MYYWTLSFNKGINLKQLANDGFNTMVIIVLREWLSGRGLIFDNGAFEILEVVQVKQDMKFTWHQALKAAKELK